MIRQREAIILAGGKGTRLAHIVPDVPKSMAPVAEMPFMRYILDQLSDAAFGRVVIADGYKRNQIESYFGHCYRGMEIIYSPEDRPLLTGGAVKKALRRCHNEWVYILNGDTYVDVDFDVFDAAAMGAIGNSDAVFVTAVEMDHINRYGTLNLDSDGIVIAFNEKRYCEHGLINGGLYLINRKALDSYPDVFSLETDYFEQITASGAIRALRSEGMFIDIGVPKDYARAQEIFKAFPQSWKLAMFDRDGTINVDKVHLYMPEELELIPASIKLLRRYSDDPECRVVVVTNQAGIAKGLYTIEDMKKLHQEMDRRLEELGCRVDAYYYCPHHPDYTGSCHCRKPSPGMLEKAMFDYGASPKNCIMYGDKDTDASAASAAAIEFQYIQDMEVFK